MWPLFISTSRLAMRDIPVVGDDQDGPVSGCLRDQQLDFIRNQLSGCVPIELPEIWVRQSGLERCAE